VRRPEPEKESNPSIPHTRCVPAVSEGGADPRGLSQIPDFLDPGITSPPMTCSPPVRFPFADFSESRKHTASVPEPGTVLSAWAAPRAPNVMIVTKLEGPFCRYRTHRHG
jgi:hypothetical protein